VILTDDTAPSIRRMDTMSPTTIHAPLRLVFALLLLTLLAPVRAVAQQHFPTDAELGDMLRYLVEDGETPGIIIGLLEADGTTRVLHHGSAGAESRPLGPQTVFAIGSINKTITGLLLADMVRRGEVSLEDPVSMYLPDHVTVPSRDGREITLLDLATHTSGLPRLPGNHRPADMSNPYADYTIERMYEFLSSHELQHVPGEHGEYSNLGFGLLGHALASAAGSTYRDLVRERILRPLGMEHSGWLLEGDLGAWTAQAHDEYAEPVSFWFGTEAIDGAGGLRASMEDMLAYLRANVGEPTTDLERSMRLAQEPRRPISGQDGDMGLGWQIAEVDYMVGSEAVPGVKRRIVMHGGATGGFRAWMGFDPQTGHGLVVLANAALQDDLGFDLMKRGAPLDIPIVAVDRDLLRQYVGTYQIAPGRVAAVRLEDGGHLTFQAPGNVRFRMYAESDSTFYLKRTPWRIAFTRGADGAVDGLTLRIGEGRERQLPRTGAETPDARALAGNVRDD